MKYEVGQNVILLDTEFKPAGNATIKAINFDLEKYLIEFSLHTASLPEEIWVPQERLTTTVDILDRKG